MLNTPVMVWFGSVLSFDPGAGSVPTVDEVDTLITASFTQNAAAYQAQLTALTNNIFSTTTSFAFRTTSDGTVNRALKQYQIGYDVVIVAIPSESEVDGVLNVTQQFLSSHFRTLYPITVGVDTIRVEDRLVLNAPYEVVYSSDIAFPSGSSAPSFEELNSNLQTAFTGVSKADYLSRLSDLGPDNTFCT
jgi:hypothetical protein